MSEYHSDKYQPLFDLMLREHHAILLESELQEVVRVCAEIEPPTATLPSSVVSEREPRASTDLEKGSPVSSGTAEQCSDCPPFYKRRCVGVEFCNATSSRPRANATTIPSGE